MPFASWSALLPILALLFVQFALAALPERGIALRLQLRRKLQHALSALAMLILYAFVLPYSMSVCMVAVCVLLAYGVHALRLRRPALNRWLIARFASLLRPHEHARLPGAFWLLVGTLLVALIASSSVTVLCLTYVAFGDPIAGLVNARRSQRQPGTPGAHKAWHGAVGMALACGALTWAALTWFLQAPDLLQHASLLTNTGGNVALLATLSSAQRLAWAVVGGVTPALIEWRSRKIDDNLTIPVLTGGVLTALQALGVLAAI